MKNLYLHGTVYNPPKDDLPYIAVILDSDNKIITSRAVPSFEAGSHLIEAILSKYAEDNNLDINLEIR